MAAFFWRYLRPRRLFVLMAVATVLAAIFHLPMAFLPKIVAEHFDNRAYVLGYLGLVLATLVAGWILDLLHSYWGVSLGEAVVRALRREVFDNLERRDMTDVYRLGPGEYVQQVTRDVMAVRDLYDETLLRGAMELAQGLAVLVALLVLDPLVTVIVLASLAALLGVIRWANRRVEFHAQRSRTQMEDILGRLTESVGGCRDIVSAGRFGAISERFDSLLHANQQCNVRTAAWSQFAGLMPAAAISLAALSIYAVGVVRSVDLVQIGAVITYVLLMKQLFPAIMAIAQTTTELALAAPSLRALRDILEPPVLEQPSPGVASVPLQGRIRNIRFERISLEVDGCRIIHDVSFSLPCGKLTAIVGPSGAGKTTLLNLLLRLFRPTHGAIYINDRPIDDYTLDSLRANLGYLPQNPFLFNDSLRENIVLAAPDEVSPVQLTRVITLAQLGDLLNQRREQGGIDSAPGYLGHCLSGGERQRIALARLLLRDPPVILCDEHVANIDVRTARLIHASLRTHFAGRTRVVVTHELAAAQDADWIVVIDEGHVVQQGTHDELYRADGLYQVMWNARLGTSTCCAIDHANGGMRMASPA